MSRTVIQVENVSKQYRLGQVGSNTLTHDINRLWFKMLGKSDPYLKIGEENDRSIKGGSEFVWGLKNISFEVKEGEVLGIIGRNGAGKSTLLKILSRTTTPTTGVIRSKGRIASLLEVGTGFHPDLSGRENIFLNGAILGMTKKEIKARFDEIVDFAGVERYIDTPVKRYSSGMYVRLAFAVAAHLQSDILIVDEVLAVGDAEFQKKCLGKMRNVSEGGGKTVLFVSHNMAAVKSLCKTGIVINNGSIFIKSDNYTAIQAYLALNRRDTYTKSLLLRTDRQGSGLLKFSNVELLDKQTGSVLSTAMSGQDVVLRIYFATTKTFTCSEIVIAIGINDHFENRIALISNDLINQMQCSVSTLQYVDITINRLPLNSGTYSFVLYCAIKNETVDWIPNAFYLNVEGGDYYNTGKKIEAGSGIFYIDYQFKYV